MRESASGNYNYGSVRVLWEKDSDELGWFSQLCALSDLRIVNQRCGNEFDLHDTQDCLESKG